MWTSLPIEIQRSIQDRVNELHILQRNQMGWDKINEYFTHSRYCWIRLHLSKTPLCRHINRLPKLIRDF